jgi:hypothetical protein
MPLKVLEHYTLSDPDIVRRRFPLGVAQAYAAAATCEDAKCKSSEHCEEQGPSTFVCVPNAGTFHQTTPAPPASFGGGDSSTPAAKGQPQPTSSTPSSGTSTPGDTSSSSKAPGGGVVPQLQDTLNKIFSGPYNAVCPKLKIPLLCQSPAYFGIGMIMVVFLIIAVMGHKGKGKRGKKGKGIL